MQQEMVDRIAASIREKEAPLDAERIARDFLKLSGSGPAPRALIRAMLSRDARFVEVAEGLWNLVTRAEADLAPPVVLCTLEIPPSAARSPWLWRIRATLWGTDRPLLTHQGAERSAALETLFEWLGSYPVASDRPGSLARWVGAQERIHALPELATEMIDLGAWQRLLVTEPQPAPASTSIHDRTPPRERPDGAETECPADSGAPLRTLEDTLARIVDTARTRGLRSWRDVQRVPDLLREQARARTWDSQWAFTPEDLAQLPEEPGVYRFLDAQGKLLYVGKAKDIRRRVAAYFRPLEEGSARRAEFLRRIQRLEVETTGTELEALLLEARLIRTHRPPWNVQVKIGPEESRFPAADQDLLALLPRAGGGSTLLALGGARVAVAHPGCPPDPEALLGALRTFYVEGADTAELIEIAPPERALVRRWLGWSRNDYALLRLADFATFAALVEAVSRLVAAPDSPQGPERLIVRDGPR